MKVYYSRSNEVNDARVRPQLLELIYSLPYYGNYDIELLEHKRGSQYNPELLNQSDVVVVGLADAYDPEPEVGRGCYEEILSALEQNKPVLLLVGDEDDLMVGSHSLTVMPFSNVGCLHKTGQSSWGLGYAYLELHHEYVYVGDKRGVHNLLQRYYEGLFFKNVPDSVLGNPDDDHNEDLLLI